MKVLRLILGKTYDTSPFHFGYHPDVNIIGASLLKHGFSCSHLGYKPEYENFLKARGAKAFFIYRDPRDQLVSQVYYMFRQSPSPARFTFKSLLMALIGDNDESPKEIGHFQDTKLRLLSPNKYISHIRRFYEIFMGWLNSDVCYCVKFEDLVGPNGGGTAEKQKREIANIARHAGIELTEQKINEIASKSFGSTWSFREGKTGSWETHFSEEAVIAFKRVAGDLLIKLGYEPDNNWESHLSKKC